MSYFTKDFTLFFRELAANNRKEWFDENKKRYEKSVKGPFQKFVEDLIVKVRKDDPAVQIQAKDAIFRIYRDVRFSKEKIPYKTNTSAVIAPGGRKDKSIPGIYIQFGAEDLRVYGGLYMLDKNQLQNVRQYISSHLKEFDKINNEAGFRNAYGELRGEKNKRIPKEFETTAVQHPLIYNKTFYYFHKMPPNEITNKNLMEKVMELYAFGKPMKKFLTEAVGG